MKRGRPVVAFSQGDFDFKSVFWKWSLTCWQWLKLLCGLVMDGMHCSGGTQSFLCSFFFFYLLNDLIQRIKGFFCGEAKLVVDWKQHQSLIILCLCTDVCLYLIAVIWIRDNNLEYCCNLPINAAFGSRSRWEHWLSGCVARCFILTFYSTGRRFYDVKRRGRKQEQQQ